jgi:hypothetical protein
VSVPKTAVNENHSLLFGKSKSGLPKSL